MSEYRKSIVDMKLIFRHVELLTYFSHSDNMERLRLQFDCFTKFIWLRNSQNCWSFLGFLFHASVFNWDNGRVNWFTSICGTSHFRRLLNWINSIVKIDAAITVDRWHYYQCFNHKFLNNKQMPWIHNVKSIFNLFFSRKQSKFIMLIWN